jgi:uncharacterized protein (UPF0276 family)
MQNYNLPALGGGAGLRSEHFDAILEQRPAFKWFEIITENFYKSGGYTKDRFDQIREHYQIIPHSVCLSIGSTDSLDWDYLRSLKGFLRSIKAPWTSDHLCFTMVDHANLNDLIPIPFTKESADNVVARVRIIQDYLEVPFLIENVTRYVTVSDREMSEGEFIRYVAENAGCGLLLDVTNAYLNSRFHGWDAEQFILSLPLERVGQVHLAGWEDDGEVIDSHDAPVPPEVWELFKKVLPAIGPTSALVEWDSKLPKVERLLQEAAMADDLVRQYGGLKRAA